jgi:type I restriction enzyme S subunit
MMVKTRIPEGWEEKTVNDTCDILDNRRIPLNSDERYFMRGDIPYYGANGVVDHINDYIFNEDLILLAEDGGNFDQYETRAIAYRISGKSWVNNHAHALRVKKPYDFFFIFYSLEHKNIIPVIRGGTRTKLNQSEVKEIFLSCPKLPSEQQKISKILQTIDQAINKTKELIGKNKKIMQGLMQDLFSNNKGRKCKLGDLILFEYGEGLPEEKRTNFGYPVYGSSGIVGYHKSFLVHEEGIIVGRKGTIGSVYFSQGYFWPIDTTYFVQYRKDLNKKYIYYQLKFLNLSKLDSSTGVPGLNRNDVYRLEVSDIPKFQQTQIANILISADNKIQSEENYLNKLTEMKAGLMQDLLTGLVRVKVGAS